jgi:hypothetical protein
MAASMDVESAPTPEVSDVLPEDQLIDEDYSDALDNPHEPQSGTWEVADGRYQVTPDSDAISTLLLDQPLPEDLELAVTFNADDVSPQYYSNAFVIFDYQSQTDFKFAGAYVGSDQWIIGHRSASGWIADAQIDTSIGAPIDALTDYSLRVTIVDDSIVTLHANGAPQLTCSYASSVTDGQLGLGTRNSVSRFDDLAVRRLISDDDASMGVLPLSESFDDKAAEHFDPRFGTWLLTDDSYQVCPEISGDGISTLFLGEELPDDLEIAVTLNADECIPQRFSNGFVVFDYQSATDFKYAGAFLHRDEWAIGHRTAEGWVDDVLVSAPLDAFTDYDVRVEIEDGSEVSLFHGDALVASHTFTDPVTDGALGLGSYNSVTRFDDFSVIDQSPISDISAKLKGGDLIISGDSGGEVQILAIQKDAFQILDRGRLLFTVEDVTGDLHVELGDARDQVNLDLNGYAFERNVAVDLGGGDNSLEVTNGSIGGHLTVIGDDGGDNITISESATIQKHARLKTGAGDDSFTLSGAIARGLFIDTGQGNDVFVLSGQVNFGFFANTGEGDDRVEILSSSVLGRNAVIKLGDGSDTLTSEASQPHMVMMEGQGDDQVSLADSSQDRHRSHPVFGEESWKRERAKPWPESCRNPRSLKA